MPQLSHPAALALVAAAALLLSGCTGDAPVVLPSPQSSTAPVFASDEEALAAAEEAYGRYLEASDAILVDGGEDPQRLLEVASESVYEYQLDGYQRAAELGHRSTGGSTFDSMELQQYDPAASAGEPVVVVYACEDISAVDILDAQGKSVVTDSRDDRFPVEIAFELKSIGEQALLVSSAEDWSGVDFCEG